jgi:hypothetical protein
MASIELIPEQEATGGVLEVYEDIKETLGIDFVPNMYRPDEGNNRGGRVSGLRLPLLNRSTHFRGAEAGSG